MRKQLLTAGRSLIADETVLDPVAASLAPGTCPQVVLAFPNHYRTGMASLGFQSVFGQLRRHVPGPVDRVFLPRDEELETHRRTRTPLFTLEGGAPVSAARLIAFSLSYELDLLNLVRMLDLAGVPRQSSVRGEHDPLVAAGGVCAAMNPAPFSSFVDLVFVGDAEVIVPRAIGVIFGRRRGGRAELLEQLAELEGVLVPALAPARPVSRVSAGPVSSRRGLAHSVLVTPNTEFGSMLLAETGRGCPWRCRFCLVGCGMGRPLWTNAGLLRRTILNLPRGGWNRVGLVASSAANHPQLDEICRLPLEDGIPVSLPSLRASSTSNRLLQALAASGQKTVTIAPEAGSSRLRALVGKREKEEDYFEFVRRLGRVQDHPFKRLKLYFIIGLPGERAEDVREIGRFSAELARAARDHLPGLTVAATVKPFVPRPHTPFQWAPMLPPGELKARMRLLAREVKGAKAPNLRLQAGGVVPALAQGMLALGGEEMARVLVRAVDQGESWRNAASHEGVDVKKLLYEERPGDTVFPWERLVRLAGREGLWSDYCRAERAGAAQGDG